MGFWDKLREKRDAKDKGFQFKIEDVFLLKNGSTVLTGEVLRGQITPGETATYVNQRMEPIFPCHIIGIEQDGTILEAASVHTRGKYGPHFGLMIEDRQPGAFKMGNFLTAP